jgi:hypothetical protein
MPCERTEQPLSRSRLEDMDVPAPMEIIMAGSSEDIYLFTCSLQSPGDTWWPQSYPESDGGARAAGTRDGPEAAPSRERVPEPRGHVTASELPSAERREPLS